MSESSLQGQEFRIVFSLYSADGKRAAYVMESGNGEVYLDEQEVGDGPTFHNRH